MGKNKSSAKDDMQFEMSFLEGVLKNSPDFVEALSVLAELCTRTGQHARGLELDRHLARLRPEDAIVLYNLACSYSLMGDVSAALGALKSAIEAGYEDFAHLEKDQDLLNLFKDQAFQDYFRSVKGTGKVS